MARPPETPFGEGCARERERSERPAPAREEAPGPLPEVLHDCASGRRIPDRSAPSVVGDDDARRVLDEEDELCDAEDDGDEVGRVRLGLRAVAKHHQVERDPPGGGELELEDDRLAQLELVAEEVAPPAAAALAPLEEPAEAREDEEEAERQRRAEEAVPVE